MVSGCREKVLEELNGEEGSQRSRVRVQDLNQLSLVPSNHAWHRIRRIANFLKNFNQFIKEVVEVIRQVSTSGHF